LTLGFGDFLCPKDRPKTREALNRLRELWLRRQAEEVVVETRILREPFDHP
jgi:hypothetical protein